MKMQMAMVAVALVALGGCGSAQVNELDRRMDLLEQRQQAIAAERPVDDPRIQQLIDRIHTLEILVSQAQATARSIVEKAPPNANTLAKAAARHDFVVSILNYADVATSRWFCGPFACFRDKAICNAIDAHRGEECLPRHTAYCRGVEKPSLMSDKATRKNAMTCHMTLENCEGAVKSLGGTCLGVE